MDGAGKWLFMMIVIPVLVAVFKVELGNMVKAWAAFKRRAFNVGDYVQLFNGATGKFDAVVKIRAYVFSFNSIKRGVYLVHADGGPEKVAILEWITWRKRPAPKAYPKKKRK